MQHTLWMRCQAGDLVLAPPVGPRQNAMRRLPHAVNVGSDLRACPRTPAFGTGPRFFSILFACSLLPLRLFSVVWVQIGQALGKDCECGLGLGRSADSQGSMQTCWSWSWCFYHALRKNDNAIYGHTAIVFLIARRLADLCMRNHSCESCALQRPYDFDANSLLYGSSHILIIWF